MTWSIGYPLRRRRAHSKNAQESELSDVITIDDDDDVVIVGDQENDAQGGVSSSQLAEERSERHAVGEHVAVATRVDENEHVTVALHVRAQLPLPADVENVTVEELPEV